jgi:hypothetical protein
VKPQLSIAKQTAFASARDTFHTARAVADRLENLVNRLAGHEPPPTSAMNEAPRNDPDGVLDELREGARDAARALSRAEACLDRLERELP